MMATMTPNLWNGRDSPTNLPASTITTITTDPIAATIHTLTKRIDTLTHELHEMQVEVRRLRAAPDAAATTIYPAGVPLRLHCLGVFEVFLNGQPLQRRHAGKGWSILKVLASRPRQPVHREELIEALWPQIDPRTANNRLRVAIHHLRRGALATTDQQQAALILCRNSCYLLDPAREIWCDVETFQRAWQTGQSYEQAGQDALATNHYLQAIQLYRGDFLAEDRYEEWAIVLREELRDLYLTMLDRLGRQAMRIGDVTSAMAHWRTLLSHDPWREDIYRQLMCGCAREGQRSQALHWYELCRKVMSDQLGLTPEPETTHLIEQIMIGEELGEALSIG